MEVFYLNDTAKDFILLCDGKRTVEDILVKMAEIYAVDEKILQIDIIDLIRDLQWKKILILE